MRNPFKRHHSASQDRTQDGKFTGSSRQPGKEILDGVKNDAQSMNYLLEVQKKMAELETAQSQAAAARMAAIRQEAEGLLDTMEDLGPEGTEGPDQESMLVQALIQAFAPKLLAGAAQTTAPGLPLALPMTDGNTSDVQHPEQQPAELPGQTLNRTLNALALVPDALWTKDMALKVCQDNGIDATNLKRVSKKLSKVL